MNSGPAKPEAGKLQDRLSNIERLLVSDPALAERLAGEVLAEVPEQPMALLFQGIARRLAGNPSGAIEALGRLCESAKDAPLPHLQLGLALRETGKNERALEAMRRAVAIKPDFGDGWLALADLLTTMSKPEAAAAFAAYIRHAMQDPRLRQAAVALREKRPADAEAVLLRQLERHPRDVVALHMLANLAAEHARFDKAEILYTRCLELAPAYRSARRDYADALLQQGKPAEALQEIERLLADDPRDAALRKFRAAILLRLLEFNDATRAYEELLREQPKAAGLWASLGHCLRIVGRPDEGVAAYRRAIALAPHAGEAYWNLANLKTHRITEAELDAMREALRNADLSDADRTHFHFALGKALEDRSAYEESFRQYSEGNDIRRRSIAWQADRFSDYVSRCRELFTTSFFDERAAYGAEARDPVFIVGLPRSGSTLVEQILASHPAVEGTAELPQIRLLAHSLAGRPEGDAYPEVLSNIAGEELRAFGEEFIKGTRAYRKLRTAFFTEKTPNNFEHLGLIHLVLPHARIVDVRRHPMATGLSLFKHLFASGQHFSYSLVDIGRYYADYVRLMDHFDSVLPGRVHRLHYEALVREPETEIRRLLDYCALPFEESCLRFHENPRAVGTPSSEQVRRPLFHEGLEHWRHYEPWLGPLAAALGPVAVRAPAAGG